MHVRPLIKQLPGASCSSVGRYNSVVVSGVQLPRDENLSLRGNFEIQQAYVYSPALSVRKVLILQSA
jgi:hypothetical protein